jgi:hypothetical protein
MGKNITSKRGSFHHKSLHDDPRVFREKNIRMNRLVHHPRTILLNSLAVDFVRLAGNEVVKDADAGEQGF